MRNLRFLVILLAAIVSCPAQELVWCIPLRGALEYRRTWNAAASEACKSAALARSAALGGKVPAAYLPKLVPSPFLCQGELTPDRQTIGDPVRELRDVLRAVAFDLGSGSVRGKFPRVLPFGDLAISGSWATPGPNGHQSVRAEITSRPPTTIAGEPSGIAARLRAFCLFGIDGTLVLQRQLDPEAGRVVAFSAELDVVVAESEREFRRFVLSDAWDFVAARDNQDADFRKRTAQAIRLGVGFVRSAVDARKSYLVDNGEDNRSYGSGRLALALLTMLHGHVAKNDPIMLRGFEELRRRAFVDTYSLAAALMAVAERYAPPGEAARIRGGDAIAAAPRLLDELDRKAVAQWTAQLLKNADPRTDPTKVLRFNYVAGPRYDTSLQQYALLGLWSAHLCGAEVGSATFAAAARHLLAVQGAVSGRLPLQLVTYAQLRQVQGTETAPPLPERRAAARGFSYVDALDPAFGSMTSAGISGLSLARAGMQARGARDRALEAEIDEAVRDAFGWLAKEFSVRANPGFAERADHHWYYWLYGLERSCELNSVAWLQGRDWYYEGALQLLAMQQANGSFRTENPSSLLVEATCFAILFLSRSTVPVPMTGR